MKIYVAAPLFCEGERLYNERLDAVLQSCGHETYLPQRDVGCVANLPERIQGKTKRQYLFEKDIEHLEWCEGILFVMDGRSPDDGACFELGYGYAKGKRCIGYKTDARGFIDGYDNLMLGESVECILRSEDELRKYFREIQGGNHA